MLVGSWQTEANKADFDIFPVLQRRDRYSLVFKVRDSSDLTFDAYFCFARRYCETYETSIKVLDQGYLFKIIIFSLTLKIAFS